MKRKLIFIVLLFLITVSISNVCASDIDDKKIEATDDTIDQATSEVDVVGDDLAISDDDELGSVDDVVGDDLAISDDDKLDSASDVVGDDM